MKLRHISVPLLISEVGGDPWAVNAGLQTGRPGEISSLAEAFYRAGICTQEAVSAFDDGRRRLAASWDGKRGDDPINDAAEVQRVSGELGLYSVQIPKVAITLEGIAVALAEAQRAGAISIASLEAQLQQTDNEMGAVLALERKRTIPAIDQQALEALIDTLERDAIDDASASLSRLQSIRHDYSRRLLAEVTVLRTEGYEPTAIQAFDAPAGPPEPLALPPPDSTPEDVTRWWGTMRTEQREALIAEYPWELGNLNGVPVETRSRINTQVMDADLRRVEDAAAKHGMTTNDITRNPGQYGLSTPAITRYANARRTREGLTEQATVGADVLLMKYQPEAFDGEGAAAIALGNPDTADNTAILVPGLGSNVLDGTLSDPDGAHIYKESTRADANKKTAVIVWIGYDAPDTWHDPGLWRPNMARTGAHALAADVNGLRATHLSTPTHITVIGHSYGSTTVADAAAYGMRADDVVLVGSPGTDMAHSANDFRLPRNGHLYVGSASADPVTWAPSRVMGPGLIGPTLGGLGADPAVDGYGSTRFKAEIPGASINPVNDHLRYFDGGSESLFSIADVVSGHGNALQRDGMTARHRGEYGLEQGIDPEAWRLPTTGHWHGNP
ncbi:putative alpha/beta hydrolase [Mycobacterium sp. Marseille-P9652]|uniref:putative alpha/beta hydrolase n=1 Tax=Mycobacterium sp. Marseille-P9652 TaxID=2654950 RepID=UPI0012E82722|nr:alpha/beta hydrolase [Mycobacterium sp. Marseille-P9652]